MADYNLVQLVFDRQNLSPNEDVAVMTCHIRQVEFGIPDVFPIGDQGRNDFISNVATWWGVVKAHMTQHITFREMRFYDVPTTPGADMGEPVKVQAVAEAATGTSGALPPQVSLSITFRTDKRKTWGRFYLPGPARSLCSDTGRIDSAAADSILNATHALTSRASSGGSLTVFSRKEWTHHDPQLIQIDDIFDVIRTRRYREPHFRKTLSAG